MKPYQVYVIENALGKRYIGLSENIENRLKEHNAGKSIYTAKYRPWKLVWSSIEMNLSDARKLENLLKKQKGGIGLAPLLMQYQGS